LGPALKRRGRSCALSRDSFGSRGLGPQCRNDEREVRPSRERVADAEAALRFLVARADVDPKAVSLLGWSNGGSTTLYAVEPKHAPTGVDFARAIAFYPGCRLPLEHGWKSRLPLLLLIGAADDWTPGAPCQQLVDEAKARGESADIVVYANAYHDFDHPNLPVHELKHLAFTAGETAALIRARTPRRAPTQSIALRRFSRSPQGRRIRRVRRSKTSSAACVDRAPGALRGDARAAARLFAPPMSLAPTVKNL
jgi:dienelactone hydrolase